MYHKNNILIFYLSVLLWAVCGQNDRRIGKLQEVFAWKQLTYNINGHLVLRDRFGGDDLDSDNIVFNNNEQEIPNSHMPATSGNGNDSGSFFVQYNNVPMGVEKWGNILFVTVPRRRYGIPATLNYLDLSRDAGNRSPGLRPYPSLRESRSLTSVYRTRIDSCDRLWTVDTGRLEIPDNHIQLHPPAIVVYDLKTSRQILKYRFKSSDLPRENSPTGLASITVDVEGDCANAYAYVPELTTYGLIVYSLRDNDSWRIQHNFFAFSPTAGNMKIAGQRFQWNDGIFSLTLSNRNANGCKTAYFHPMVSTQEFAVSTCLLKNRTLATRSYHGDDFSVVGDRGPDSQSTMHGYHIPTRVIFYADIARNAISCWPTTNSLTPSNIALIAQDSQRLIYPSDLHVTGDEVWLMANTMPKFIYSRLDTNQYNFFIYRASVRDLISGTICENSKGRERESENRPQYVRDETKGIRNPMRQKIQK